MSVDKLVEELRIEVANFCNNVSEATNPDDLTVITDKEIADDSLNLTDILLSTEKGVDRRKEKLVDVINRAINDEASLDDIIQAATQVVKHEKKGSK